MRACRHALMAGSVWALLGGLAWPQQAVELPPGVTAVWDLGKAWHQVTSTRERICINGLWRWQPVAERSDSPPVGGWGYLKVPGLWPGTRFWMHRDSQVYYPHPNWASQDLGQADMAWYQREIVVPAQWAGRRISLTVQWLNSYAAVYLDGVRVGEIQFPGGELELTDACRPGTRQVLSLYTVALPLNQEIVSYADAGAGTRSRGRVLRRGLCGDVFLDSMPTGPRIGDVKVDTSVREGQITLSCALAGLDQGQYRLRGVVMDGDAIAHEMQSDAFRAADLQSGRLSFSSSWRPDKLWDLNTPQNQYDLQVSLLDEAGRVLDSALPVRFGFRELWIDGRDFYLNGTRIWCSANPLDNAQIGPAAACYAGARESLLRQRAMGTNLMYTHNYDCLPGSHLGFEEILRAADDVGMLISFSMPHVKDYDWKAPDAERANGYARHAEYYVRQAQNHPSVVMYSLNHNYTGYSQDMNPDLIDGVYNPFPDPTGASELRSDPNAVLARRGEAIVRALDPTRVIYHHSSGNNGQLYTLNCYLNFVPVQERSDWFEHWATQGVKPLFLCEYGEPIEMTWSMHRGWFEGERSFTNGRIKHQFCTAEFGAQFLGDRSFDLTEPERANLRFEASRWRANARWFRWDYPFAPSNAPTLGVPNYDEVQARYITANWRAFRTWGVSVTNHWGYSNKWKLRDDVDRSRRDLPVDWENLQRPGFSPDYIENPYNRIDTAYEWNDWIPSEGAKAWLRHNQPLLAYLGGGPERFTTQDHNFLPGETVHKQIVVINNSRVPVTCQCSWSLALPHALSGKEQLSLPTGEIGRVPLRAQLPADLPPGRYELRMTASFSTGEQQQDTCSIHVLSPPPRPQVRGRIALFDPLGETTALLRELRVECEPVGADANLAGYDALIVGKRALTPDGPAPEITGVREGLCVLVFEQTAAALERRLGFRVQEYGLRDVFRWLPDHPLLAGLEDEHLHDWRGAATLLPPRLDAGDDPNKSPTVRWCGIEVTRPWRCGNWGNVASVLIEKPSTGDFLPLIDGGFSLQYAPLLMLREGAGMVLFCQMDVTGRTEQDPAAQRLVCNLLEYLSEYTPPPTRQVLYAGEAAGRAHLQQMGLSVADYRGGSPAADEVLVVGPGADLAAHASALAGWLRAGGHALALALDEPQARALLPDVTMTAAEHICAVFPPPASDSPLAGVGPADVLIRDPREIPLVTGGAQVVGDGVLAMAADGRVVLCQLAPWHFDYQNAFHVKMTFRRTSYLLARLLANLGVRAPTPVLERFADPLPPEDGGESIARNPDFSVDDNGDGRPDGWNIQASGPEANWARETTEDGGWAVRMSLPQLDAEGKASMMLSQADVPMREGQWYRLHVRARAEGPAGLRVALVINKTDVWRSLFDYQYLYPKPQWRDLVFLVCSKGSAEDKTRLQLWYTTPGTVWVSQLRVVPCPPPTEGRWSQGLYLDQPVEMDDPYRFFRW